MKARVDRHKNIHEGAIFSYTELKKTIMKIQKT